MEIKLVLCVTGRFQSRAYNSADDDIRSVLIDICRKLSEKSEFMVSGFGQNRWPVDVVTDLPIFLEQLPALLRAVSGGEEADVDFYEQGIERHVFFEPLSDGYMARCISYTDWKPIPEVEFISKEDLHKMLLASRDDFLSAAECAVPEILNHAWIKEWINAGEGRDM